MQIKVALKGVLYHHKIFIGLCFATIYLVWGTTFFAITVALEDFPPFLLATLRFLIAAITLYIYGWFLRVNFFSHVRIKTNAIIGLALFVGGQGLIIWSQQHQSSGKTALLAATIPFWYVMLDKPNRSYYLKNKSILFALVLGFIGLLFLTTDQGESDLKLNQQSLIAALAVSTSVILWVTGTLWSRNTGHHGHLPHNLFWQLITAAITCLCIAWLSGELDQFNILNTRLRSWFALLYLSVFGSVVALMAYLWLLTQKPAAMVATHAYINPLVAVLVGWWLLNEEPSNIQLAAMLTIVFSAFLINNNQAPHSNTTGEPNDSSH